jgi:hypothetical protein
LLCAAENSGQKELIFSKSIDIVVSPDFAAGLSLSVNGE